MCPQLYFFIAEFRYYNAVKLRTLAATGLIVHSVFMLMTFLKPVIINDIILIELLLGFHQLHAIHWSGKGLDSLSRVFAFILDG